MIFFLIVYEAVMVILPLLIWSAKKSYQKLAAIIFVNTGIAVPFVILNLQFQQIYEDF